LSAIAETFRNLGSVRLIAIAGVGIGLIAFFMFLISRLAGPEMALLYGDLDVSDSSRIVAKLESLAVPYDIRGNGTQILVPRDRVPRLRMAMAEEGLPTGGSVGYELFDQSDSFGTTSFVQNINHLRALEGELARTIRSISTVEAARVHLVIPRRQLFSRDKEEPSASIVLQLRGASRFTSSQVLAVRHLVAAAVPGLKPTRISVIDDGGNLLARTAEDGEDGASGMTADEMRRGYEHRLARTIEGLLERSVGIGKARAEVTAEMDFNRITTNSETYDPEGQVVRSTQTVEESADSSEREGENAVTVGTNIPEPGIATDLERTQSTTRSLRTEETVNYEISKTVKNHIHESGTVSRLSVAVLIDGTDTTNEDGTTTYVPRSNEEVKQIEKLVRSAIGYDADRGDSVEIVNMRFAAIEDEWPEEATRPLFGLSKNDYFRIAEILVLGIVAMLVILLVVRPLMARVFEALPSPRPEAGGQEMLSDQSHGPAPALAAPAPGGPAVGAGAAGETQSSLEQMIDINQVDGRVRASSLKKIGEIVERHPDETVSIIRNWLFQES
jgi:flagellar M-ring protein FliF